MVGNINFSRIYCVCPIDEIIGVILEKEESMSIIV